MLNVSQRSVKRVKVVHFQATTVRTEPPSGSIAATRCAPSMRRFDVSCLTTIEHLEPEDIAAIREKAGVSQGVFACYLNVPAALVSQWEIGRRRPTGAAVKLLSIVKRKGLDAIA
jgi:putative transcriptional regulator